ncbi:hypothetical protein F4808DRAFT_401837 [Astrocystis sublimbata]|nr:hypothetical protein F4808DRAFT_401470 [Astrocystis sublimbata]KAI0190585.1 hypothetical protein F4808DRAFT_401837 [Astrocystis sublimbata]
MAQTVYRRPWSQWIDITVVGSLTIAWFYLLLANGLLSPPTVITGAIDIVLLAVFSVFDPETTIMSQGTLADGTVVKVRRPLVGLRRCESQVGLTGGYEVRVDGYRYEPAYIRI